MRTTESSGSVRRTAAWRASVAVTLAVIGAVGLGALAPNAGAQTAGGKVNTAPVDVVIQAGAADQSSPHNLPTFVSVFYAGTQTPAPGPYSVSAGAQSAAGTSTTPVDCVQTVKTQPGTPRNVYTCQLTLTSSGTYTLSADVHLPGAQGASVGTGNTKVAFRVPGTSVKRDIYNYPTVGAHASDTILLSLHTIASILWIISVALISTIAVPRLRRAVSGSYLRSIQTSFGSLRRASLSCAVVSTGTGVYLLIKETAYKTPFTPSRWHLEHNLAYAKPYFFSLLIKLIAYVLMEVATFVILIEARRVVAGATADEAYGTEVDDRYYSDAHAEYDEEDDEDDYDGYEEEPEEDSVYLTHDEETVAPAGRGGTATLTRRSRLSRSNAERRVSPGMLRAALATQVFGTVTIYVCVVFLKYFHELVEASRAIVAGS